MKLNLVYCVVCVMASSLWQWTYGQESRLKYTNKLYERLAYYEAIQGYEEVIARKTDSSQVAVRLADCYDKTGNVEKAVEWYDYVRQTGSLSADQQIRLALLKRQLSAYDESVNILSSYEQQFGENDISAGILSYGDITPLLTQESNFKLRQEGVNTEASEIGTTYTGQSEVLLASSSRVHMASNRIHSWTGAYFYDLYRASIAENGAIGKMQRIKGEVETKYHDGPAAYHEASGYLYFTRNNYMDGKTGMDEDKVVRLKLFRAKLDGDRFSDVEELNINSDQFSNAHPTISADGTRLFFVSDRPGGYGGMDLYTATIKKDGTIGEPVNMGDMINTSQNDVFPFYNSEEQLLFFSSEGHAGLGGLDVFVARMNKDGEVRSIENLGVPINSNRDDFSFVQNNEQTMGYFSSNRAGGKGSDDVYGFEQLKPILNGPVLSGNASDLVTGNNLENVTVYLTDQNGKVLDSVLTDADGNFELSLENVSGDFVLTGKKDGYVTESKTIPFVEDKLEYKEDLALAPVLKYYFAGLVSDSATSEALQGVTVSVVDAKTGELFATLVTNKEGDFTTAVIPYVYADSIDYSFRLEKDGYVTKTVDYEEVLALTEKLDVNGKLDMTLSKVVEGETDLATIFDINPIYFDLNSSYIRKDAAVELDKIVRIMKDNPGMVIELGSHTDTRASDHYNIWLSDRRAKSSANYIISRGISSKRIYGKGYGETRLKVTDAEIEKVPTEEEKEALHQLNRRTEFIVVRLK